MTRSPGVTDVDAGADRLDLADDLEPGVYGKRLVLHDRPLAAADLDVRAVDRREGRADAHLAGARQRPRDLAPDELLRPAVAVDLDRALAHGRAACAGEAASSLTAAAPPRRAPSAARRRSSIPGRSPCPTGGRPSSRPVSSSSVKRWPSTPGHDERRRLRGRVDDDEHVVVGLVGLVAGQQVRDEVVAPGRSSRRRSSPGRASRTTRCPAGRRRRRRTTCGAASRALASARSHGVVNAVSASAAGSARPVVEGDLVRLAVGVVVAALRAPALVAAEQHRRRPARA